MFTNLIMLVAALFMALSKTAKSFEMILVGRLLYGIGSGMSPCLQGLQAPHAVLGLSLQPPLKNGF